jgi:hypothetical protein
MLNIAKMVSLQNPRMWMRRNRLDPLTTFRDVLLGSAGVPPAAGKMPAFPAWMPISATDGCDGV